jgi:hypothetical protein
MYIILANSNCDAKPTKKNCLEKFQMEVLFPAAHIEKIRAHISYIYKTLPTPVVFCICRIAIN